MVRCHQIDHAISKPLPQGFAVFAAANWRCTFAQGRSLGNVFRNQVQIVRASPHASRQSLRTRRSQLRESPASRKMDKMQTEPIFPAQR